MMNKMNLTMRADREKKLFLRLGTSFFLFGLFNNGMCKLRVDNVTYI